MAVEQSLFSQRKQKEDVNAKFKMPILKDKFRSGKFAYSALSYYLKTWIKEP